MTHGGHDFLTLQALFAREREIATPLVRTLRLDPPPTPPAEWLTLGTAYELCAAARDPALSPGQSAALARLAVAVAGNLGTAYPPVVRAQILARAWKELANAERIRGDHHASLAALDHADAALGDDPAVPWDEAVLALARATTLSNMNRQEEALALVEAALPVFERLGDRGRVAQCHLLHGNISHRRGDFAGAGRSYREASRHALATGDIHTAGGAWINLGALAAEGGSVDAAMTFLGRACALFREIGARDEVARGQRWIGVALLAAGQFDQAIDILGRARGTFRTLGMPEEAGLAGLDILEAHIALGRTRKARLLLERIIEEFRRAGLNERALVALTYLRSLPAPRRATVTHVRSYLARLQREPHLLFAIPGEE